MKKIVQRTRQFEKSFKKISKKQQLIFLEKLELFLTNEHDKMLKTHRLKGERNNEFSFSLSDDIRAIYTKEIISKKEVMVFTFINVGTHNKVY